MNKQVRTFVLLVAGAVLASCGGEAPPTGPRGGGQPQMNRTIKASPSFEEDIQEIFVRGGCTDFGCHASGQGDVTLHPNDPANFAEIVNVASRGEPDFLLIKPFDPTNSYIMMRLENRQAFGVSMPPGFQLDSIDLTNFRNWITAGAPNN